MSSHTRVLIDKKHMSFNGKTETRLCKTINLANVTTMGVTTRRPKLKYINDTKKELKALTVNEFLSPDEFKSCNPRHRTFSTLVKDLTFEATAFYE